ncbi:leucine--tRNA ligase [Thermoleptolyngbya sp. C42_A2020_037]|uniref:leucine--tRNA ligase n=1 Tax=Thermoleptolyngbya sp. C42_A2020_037 TaxID=2747799 RepID=UPI0019F4ABCD|nr:leucine--tRNA ligase [Thermoleptolyngbya sp. C42_A2020_037]MBF2086567.1 leucine--tRNA ligase [Thermoleptolyngbya sp. C42_A2020_037]
MESRYNPAEIEEKWQAAWDAQGLDQTLEDPSKPKFYALSMFPYPSGNLHMGHVRNYTITDVIARVQRMRGYRVLHPMGWDAFGLPAENAAIDRGVAPAKWTYQNVAQMRAQLKRLGLSYDWNREVTTCSPDYYKWTQWIFLQFFQAGLAYQKEAAVNWDPIDQTVLANEQVDSEGKSWRSGAKVERRLLKQWFLKITDYAEQLLQDLNQLDGWPERVRLMQENWIGKSTGAEVVFKTETGDDLTVYTTRPDTLWGATFMVLSPEHPLVDTLTTADQSAAVAEYKIAAAGKSEIDRTAEDREKTGVWTGSYAINPVNDEKIPVWIADYVLMGYGTGAIMAVPAHDQRDFEFARKFGLKVKVVVQPEGETLDGDTMTVAHAGEGVMVHSGPLDGIPAGKGAGQSVEAAVKWLEANGKGKGTANYRLRDWLISRQRYWGCPIPVVHCPSCGTVPVPDDQLPVTLPEQVEFSGRGPSPLAKLEDWVNVPCPTCGTPAKRETDTMDTFICSSWYFLRYPDARNENAAFDPAKTNDWMPVDQYVGGIEHAILHLLYSRFFTKVLRDRYLLNFDEPFKRLLTQGMVQAAAYKNPITGKYIAPADIADLSDPRDPATGDQLEVVFEKMSKSKYNGIDPKDVLEKYGADTARMFILFKAPPEKDLEWDDADVEGQFRFLNRVWRLVAEFQASGAKPQGSGELTKPEKDLRRAIHTAIQEITEDLEGDYQFNTAVSELMKLSNALNDAPCKESPVYAEGIETLLALLAPFAPHIAEELWHLLGHADSVHHHAWPVADPEALVVDEIPLVIQIMGKTRGTIQVPAGADAQTLEKLATESELAQRYIEGKTIKKVIVVPGKLVNFVVQ